MHDAVLLDDLRCDGSGHDGCQAGCRIYWKESWLRRVDETSRQADADADGDARTELETLAAGGGRATRHVDGVPAESYGCQATEAVKASEPLRWFDMRQYVRELTARNV